MSYNYEKMMREIENITEKQKTLRYFHIGRSVSGKKIICFRVGSGNKKLFLAGAFHGMEYLTAAFLVKFAAEINYAAENKAVFFGRDAGRLIKNVSLYIAPMINPDGVNIAAEENKRWQANARGVDINHNFDADWEQITKMPAPSKYGGEYPHSEPETKAVADFVRREQFDMVIAFHSQGEEIYYDFKGKTAPRSLEIAEKMSAESSYSVCVPEGTAAFGGFKDWFIKEFNREGFTVEMGKGENPLPLSMLEDVYEPCSRIILAAAEEMLKNCS